MPKIICVQSFRHGTGQSNLIASLAVKLAVGGQRIGIVDPNSKIPGIHTLFHLDDEKIDYFINDYLWDEAPQTTDQEFQRLWKVGDGEIVVMGGGVHMARHGITFNQIPHLLEQGCDVGKLNQDLYALAQRLQLDFLLIDSQPGLSNENLLYMTLSDILLLSLCLDIQSFQGMAITVDVAKRLEIPHILLLANQVLPEFAEADVRHQLEDAYGQPVIGVLRFASEMQELASQDIFCVRFPDHPLTTSIEAIARRLKDLSWIDQLSSSEGGLEGLPLRKFTSSQPATGRPSLFHILSLPQPQRQIVNYILRHREATLSEIAHHLKQDEVSLQPMLNFLVEQGFLVRVEKGEDNPVVYKPYLLDKRFRSGTESLWLPLDSNPAPTSDNHPESNSDNQPDPNPGTPSNPDPENHSSDNNP